MQSSQQLRGLTMVDLNHHPNPVSGTFYIMFAVVSFLAFIWIVYFGYEKAHFDNKLIKFLLPFSLLTMCYDNIVMAVLVESEEQRIDQVFADALFLTHPFIVPTLLIVTFETTYIVHKLRSVRWASKTFIGFFLAFLLSLTSIPFPPHPTPPHPPKNIVCPIWALRGF